MAVRRKRPLKKLSSEEWSEVLLLKEHGLSNAQIAERFGISGQSINGYVNISRIRAGIPRSSASPYRWTEVQSSNPLLPGNLPSGFEWHRVPAVIRVYRVGRKVRQVGEVKPPIDAEYIGQNFGQGHYRLVYGIGELALYEASVRISSTYGPPRRP